MRWQWLGWGIDEAQAHSTAASDGESTPIALWPRFGCIAIGSSDEVHVVDALAITGDEGRGSLRKAPGSRQTDIDPEMSEWGNPPARVAHAEYIGVRRRTWRTETSK